MNERGPIQISPPGLLNLLQLKSEGRSVSNLSDTCIPSLEMSTWWLRAAAQLDQTAYAVTVAAAVVATYQDFTAPSNIMVPNGEWWYVHEFAATMATGAAGSATNVRLARATVRYSGMGEQVQLGASQTMLLTVNDLWLPPGTKLGFFVDTVVGVGGLTATVRQLRYTRLGS